MKFDAPLKLTEEGDEQAFKEKANLKAMKVWLALIAIMTLSYGSDLSKGIYTATQYVVFLVMAWVPFAIGLLTLKLKGERHRIIRMSWLSDMAFLCLRGVYHGLGDRLCIYSAVDEYADSVQGS